MNPIEQFAANVLARAVLSRQSTADLSADMQVSDLIEEETMSEVASPKEDNEAAMLLSGESSFARHSTRHP